MRFALIAATTLLGVSACSASPSATPSVAASKVPTQLLCDKYLARETGYLGQLVHSPDSPKAVYESFRDYLRAQAPKAEDPILAKGFADFAKSLDKFAADVENALGLPAGESEIEDTCKFDRVYWVDEPSTDEPACAGYWSDDRLDLLRKAADIVVDKDHQEVTASEVATVKAAYAAVGKMDTALAKIAKNDDVKAALTLLARAEQQVSDNMKTGRDTGDSSSANDALVTPPAQAVLRIMADHCTS